MTVDWTRWMESEEVQRELLAKYRQVITDEIMRAKLNNWQRFEAAIYGRRT